MRLILDENVTERLVDTLASLGIDAVSVNRDHKGSDDATLLLVAAELDRVFVTYNVSHFALLHRAWISWSSAWALDPLPVHSGMLLIHPAPGYDFNRIAGEISLLFAGVGQPATLRNRAFAWNAVRDWHEL